MNFRKPLAYYEAVATMTGCVIGAGIFAIPYVVFHSGFFTGMLVLLALGIVMLIVNLMTGEISLRTNKCMQLVGYAEKYCGKKGKLLMGSSMVIGVYGALIAYTIGISRSLYVIFGGTQLLWAIIFYAVFSIIIFGGLKILERSELYMEALKLGLFIAVMYVLFSSKNFSTSSFTGFNFSELFLPYGVILFAYMGTAAIPEIRQELTKCKRFTKEVLIVSSVLSIVCYILFAIGVVGVSGSATTQVATVGLAEMIKGAGYVLLHLFAILAMASSCIILGYVMKESYRYDFKIPHSKAWLLTISIPIVLFVLGAKSFIGILDIAGSFAGGIAGITLIVMHYKAIKISERKPEYNIRMNWLAYGALIIVFSLGILYQFSFLL